VGRVTPEAYHGRVAEAGAFLRGERPEPLKELQQLMEDASAKLDFERAVALRDTLLLLRAAVKQKARMASTPEMRAEDGQAGVAELAAALGLERPARMIEAFDISNISGTFAVASLVCAVDGLPRRARYRRFRIRTVQGSDDPAMMAEVIRRRYTRLQGEGQELPDLVLVDGGLTQVRAARGELQALGLERVPVAGLAKRFEELYWREGELPVRLPRDSRALRVLQQLRDEAHRFALTYHRYLRSRRLRESVLDAVPGIGEKRKQLLLAHFRSARRLAAATEAEIAAVPGVGPALAREIKGQLAAAR
jgi:excinuclease ABC subunit C